MEEYKRYKPYNTGVITSKLNNLLSVDKIITEINKIEAERVGLTILSRSTDPNKSLYRYNNCLHTEFLQPTHVRRNNIKCNTCFRIKEIHDANNAGFLFLHKTKGYYRKFVRSCGHVAELTMNTVRLSKDEKCQQCFIESITNTADRNGYNLIKSLEKGRWLIQFKSCGHEKEIHHQQISRGNAVCRICLTEEHISLTRNYGLEYKHSTSDRYGVYKLPCGHEKELRQDHAEDGSWLCHTCGDSHYTKSSNVYLIKFTVPGFSWLKLGFAKHVELRASNYGVPKDTVKEIIEVVPFETGYAAMIFEKEIHSKYKNMKYPKSKMKEYHSTNGFTECYPESFLPTLLNELRMINKNKSKDNDKHD